MSGPDKDDTNEEAQVPHPVNSLFTLLRSEEYEVLVSTAPVKYSFLTHVTLRHGPLSWSRRVSKKAEDNYHVWPLPAL